MKKQNIFDVGMIVSMIGFIVGFILMIQTPPSVWGTVLFVSTALLAIIIYLWYEREKERANPLSYKRTMEALQFAAAEKQGKKDLFIKVKGIQMYEHLLDLGFIHECRCMSLAHLPEDSIPYWEITRLGLKKAKNS